MTKSILLILLMLNYCAATSCVSTDEISDAKFIEWCMQMREAAPQPYYPIISLGINCQPAYQLRIHGLRYEAFPFDWIICPFEALITLLEDRFAHFLDPAYLELVTTEENKHILNTYYGINFLHDFRLNEHFMEDYQTVYNTYCRRIERFYRRLNEASKALLIRRKISKAQALQLQQVLHKQFPDTDFLILAVNNTHEIKTNWGIEQVHNYYMPIETGQTWKGNRTLWQELFTTLKLNTSCDEPQDALFKQVTLFE